MPVEPFRTETSVTEEVLVHLVFDPYRIYAGEGQRVAGLAQELAAFPRSGSCFAIPLIRQPATRAPTSSTGFPGSISAVSGPSRESGSGNTRRAGSCRFCSATEPPAWLTDETIVAWTLLQRPAPVVQEDWAATVSSWLLPGFARPPRSRNGCRSPRQACPSPNR